MVECAQISQPMPRLLRTFILAAAAVVVPVCPAGTEIIAHRGAMYLAPENTLASQRLAYELGADVVEVDVRLTKDGVPINFHDHTLDRTTDGEGGLGGLTLAELKQLDAGSWFHEKYTGERVPTIAEAVAVAQEYNRKILLDVKGQYMADKVAAVIRESGIPMNHVYILTWWDAMTTEYVTRLPQAKHLRGPSVFNPDTITGEELMRLRQIGVNNITFSAGGISREALRRLHAEGFEAGLIYAPPGHAALNTDLGLDHFWTDYADRAVSNQQRQRQQWKDWAAQSGLAPDAARSWMDPDGDGLSNLEEYAFGLAPMLSSPLPPAVPAHAPGRSPAGPPQLIDWQVNLREDWSRYLIATPQYTDDGGVWRPLAGDCCEVLSPTQLRYRFPVGTAGRRFYRLRFDLKQP
jgi:Glycerophosphoryl diester phosphodiesterase family